MAALAPATAAPERERLDPGRRILDRGESASRAWRRATPQEAGLDPKRIAAGIQDLRKERGTACLVVVHDGLLIAEASFHGADCTRARNVKSISKSLLSALVGIALRDHLISGLDQNLGVLLPKRIAGVSDKRKRKITLRELLTMTSGLASTSFGAYGDWVASSDWVRYVLDRRLVAKPGSEYAYSTGNAHLVSAILTRVAGTSTLRYGRGKLFVPLGLRVLRWRRDPQGIYLGGNDMWVSALDLARFGQLYLQDGEWEGKQLVPREWVRESTRPHSRGWPERFGGYGYLWWVPEGHTGEAFFAEGSGSQYVYVSRPARMVIVLTCDLSAKGEAFDRRVQGIFQRDFEEAVPSATSRPGLVEPLSPRGSPPRGVAAPPAHRTVARKPLYG